MSATSQKSGRRAAVVLMASDGTERSDGALRVAAARAQATGATLEVVTVIPTEPMLATDNLHFGEAEMLRRWTVRRTLVEQQVVRVLGRDSTISVTVLAGNPAYTISRLGVEHRAALVVVGLGRHFMTHHILGDETALQLARIARVPVLAVPAIASSAPRYAVVAIDFSDISTRTAQLAIEAVSDDGRVDLVHVLPAIEDAYALDAQLPYERFAETQLTAVAAQLVVPTGVIVNTLVLHGRPAAVLLDYARRVDADLISTGTHGRGFVARAILGTVTTKLLRGAECALLTVPRDPLPVLAPTRQDTVTGESRESPLGWSRLLADFTRRNAGRRTIIDVDDLDLGAQAEEYNYPLLAASYSELEGRLNLMLGDRFAGGHHLARAIGSVIALDVLTDGAGHDVALRVQHGTSQTLLTFAA